MALEYWALRKSCGRWDFSAVRLIYPRQDVCLHEQTFKQKLSLVYWYLELYKSHFIKQSLPLCVYYVSVDLCFVN